MKALELEALALATVEQEELELETLAQEALELEALALAALELEELELEALELLTLELEVLALGVLRLAALVLETLCTSVRFLFCRHRRLRRHLTRSFARFLSHPALPVCAVRIGRRVPHPRPHPVPGTHVMAVRPSSVPLRVPLPPPPKSSLPTVPDPEDLTLMCSWHGRKQEDFECFAAAVPHLVAMLLAPKGDPDAPDILNPRSYAEAITGPYSSQRQTAMDAEMASWKSTDTYVDAVPPSEANIVDGMLIFRVKRPPGSPLAFKARCVARGFSQRQRDYELHSRDFSTAFLQGSLHEEIWLRRPPGFTGSFLAGTQWSLRRPVYGLHHAPREWHDTLKTTLAALGFAPSTANLSLFLCTDTSLPSFYVLVYIDDLVFANADSEALALVLQRFGFRYSSPQSTPLPTKHSLSAPPSDESVEPSGPYPELVGNLMYLMTCTRPDLAYPLSILARYVAPGRHRPEHWEAAKRVLRYLCSTSGMGLVLAGRGPVVLTGHEDASWVEDLATQRSSSCEAGIYAGAMAAQELRWLTYLLTNLGERHRSSPVLCADNKAMIALCQEHRLEHRTKHITLWYFLGRELQQRGQLCLAYVATWTNTADVFTKALQSACFAFLDWSCDHLFSSTLPMGVCQNCYSA
ncbi:unnamed protein product [Closterium sp. NIES-53]